MAEKETSTNQIGLTRTDYRGENPPYARVAGITPFQPRSSWLVMR